MTLTFGIFVDIYETFTKNVCKQTGLYTQWIKNVMHLEQLILSWKVENQQ